MISPKKQIEGVVRISDRFEPQPGLVRLDKNERLGPFPEFRALMDCLRPEDLTAYPVLDPVYKELAEWLDIGRDHLFLTGGSDQAIKSVFEVCVAPGDVVLVPRPTFAMYGVYCDMFGAERRELIYTRALTLSVEAVCDAMGPEVKLAALPNPNSPTGTQFSQTEFEVILKRAAENDVLVLVDEAYYYFSDVTVMPLVERFDNLVVTRTFSKACGLAGARLGFLVSTPENIDYLQRVKPMYEASGVALKLGRFLMQHPHIIEDYARQANEGKRFLKEWMRTIAQPFETEGNFLVVRMAPGVDIPALVAGLKARGYLIKGSFPDTPLEDCIRITTGPVSLMEAFQVVFQGVYADIASE